MRDFDILGSLPGPGTTVLEASAGTGKTWTIAALVARYIAEGRTTLDKMLVVTFGRAASQELRDRVRARLVEVEGALTTGDGGEDALLEFLIAGGEAERSRRLLRVREALTGFDAAAIVTIHQFCHTVLRGLGIAGDTDPRARLVEDLDDLLSDVVDDLYLAEVSDADGAEVAAGFSRGEAWTIAVQAAIANPLARLEPQAAPSASPAWRRVRFAQRVRVEFDRRKRQAGLLSYDDLLAQLADALADPDALARQRMRERWHYVLVDEFQDTDPTQWQVFHRAFHEVPGGGLGDVGNQPRPTLVLIGDPKQAIYAFRGGDVCTYLQAKMVAEDFATLSTNYRTDRAVLDCINVLWEGAQLGDPEIVVHPVGAHEVEPRIEGVNHEPFRLRALTHDRLGADPDKPIPMGTVRPAIGADVAAQVLGLLTDPQARFEDRRLGAGDIAVLAYSRNQLDVVRRALAAVGIPAVLSGSGSVFDTPAATQWLTLIEALEQPHRTQRVRAAALTDFFGHTIDTLMAGGDDLTEALSTTVRDWLDLFRGRGIAAVFEAALELGMEQRLLGQVNGERELTDLRHLAEVLHRETSSGRAGIVALLAWLRHQMREERHEVAGERTRRLDSDATAVQLVTIHGSKGLQWPVAMLPFAFDRFPGRERDQVLTYHDDEGARVLHVGGLESRPRELDDRARDEDLGERLRLLYVAMTRAEAQLVAWWAPSTNTPTSELHRLVLGRQPGQAEVPAAQPLGPDEKALAWLLAWGRRGAFTAEAADPGPVNTLPPPPAAPALDVREFTRSIDHRWRRTSYSALSAASHDAGPAVGTEPEIDVKDDEPDAVDAATLTPAPVGGEEGVPSPMADLPSGAQFGSLVHAVLEHADPAAPDFGGDLRAELRARVEEEWINWPQEVDRELLADALVEVCSTSLGPDVGGVALRDIALADRLAEMEFELPLTGGDTRTDTSGPRLADLAPLLRRHLPEGDPVRGWADALGDPALGDQDLRGYLTGSVDVVLRVGGRFFVVDYKTNWLGSPDTPLTSHDYTPAALDAAMGHSAYPLQALLYAVVLHRFLRWRLVDYDPATHVGGVLYLYLRGMCGPQTPLIDGRPCGVFSWKPPTALVSELSDLLDGGDLG